MRGLCQPHVECGDNRRYSGLAGCRARV